MSIFKSCDVRGIVGAEWDAADALRIGGSLGRMLRRRGQSAICVGGDFRRSTPPLKAALVEGLRRLAIDVADVGQVPTPVVQFAARQSGCANLAVVTASHSPGECNGIKFLVDGRPPVPELMIELQAGTDMTSDLFRMGALSTRNVVADYEAWIIPCARDLVAAGTCHSASVLDLPRAPSVRGNATDPVPDGRAHAVADENAWPPQRVAVDTMGGACTDIAPRVLAAAGYHVVTVDPQLDADFERRDPNPAQDRNLQQLIEAVLQQQADVGLALDGDGDRVIFVDGLGHIVRPEQIAALLVEHCFPGSTVVFDLKCASLVPRTVRAHGGTPVMQPSGHGFIKSTMLDRQAQLGVEVSGHHFFGVLQGGDDGLFTALVVLELLRRRRLSLQAHVERIGWPSITPDLRVPFTGDSRAALELIAAHCGGQISRMDGVRAEYPDGWALARASITEPAMTFRFEGHKDEHVRRVVTRFLAGVPELRQKLLERIS